MRPYGNRSSPRLRAVAWLAAVAVTVLAVLAPLASQAAELDGVSLPETRALGDTTLRLNGMGLRTYSWLKLHIYVAGLYLEHPTHSAAIVMDSTEKKLLEMQFQRDVEAKDARQAWRDGFADNCKAPCQLPKDKIEKFVAEVPAFHTGDRSTLTFLPQGLEIKLNGKVMGRLDDPEFARLILATFIGPVPPSPGLKAGLLGQAGE